MTKEEASLIIGNIPINGDGCYSISEYQQAKARAIEALEQQPCDDNWRFYYNHGYAQAKRDLSCDDCISRQAVLEQTYFWSKDEFLRVTNPFDYLRKRINDIPSVKPQEPKWIPVSEKLPENRNQEVLISLEWGIDIGRYSDGEWHSEWNNHYDDGNVIAWMPLPAPFEPQESEGEE